MYQNNTLIKASAGSGKTYSLATWMLKLLALHTPPAQIVALTFSRAAAAEIFNKFIARLAAAAQSPAAARQEAANLSGDFSSAQSAAARQEAANLPDDFSSAQFRDWLRRVIAEQHCSLIGTIDSFMQRLVRVFPAEMGLPLNNLIILDNFAQEQLNLEVCEKMLQQALTDETTITDFYMLFRYATAGVTNKTYDRSLQKFVAQHHANYLRYRDTDWRATAITQQLPVVTENFAALAQLWRDSISEAVIQKDEGEAWEKVAQFIANFTGKFTAAPTPLKNLLTAWSPTATELTFNYNAKKITFSGAAAQPLNEIATALLAYELKTKSDRGGALKILMDQFEQHYAQSVRAEGKLTFSDIPRLLNEINAVAEPYLKYRLDCQLQHWALDEFQDTSRNQWNAIKDFVENAIDDTERQVFVVGDMKQAIYGWREGDVEIFNELATSQKFTLENLAASYRFGENIAQAVNQIFGGAKIAQFIGATASAAAQKWQAQWVAHTGVNPNPDFVKIMRVEKDANDPKDDDFITPLIAELNAVKPWNRGLTCAILVRTNNHAAAIAESLRAQNIPATYEGESGIADTPIIAALLNLLLFCEHPTNRAAQRHCEILPLCKILFKEPQLTAARVTQIQADIAQIGLVATLQTYREKLIAAPEIGDDDKNKFTQQRLAELLRAAAAFVATALPTQTLTDFVEYVLAIQQRDFADPRTIKVLTLHRSKGLGFDWVIFPLFENNGFNTAKQEVLYGENDAWLLEKPHERTCKIIPALAAAENRGVNDDIFEALCVNYVAMTRAKRALTVLLKSTSKTKTATQYFADHIEAAVNNLPYQKGTANWYVNCQQAHVQSTEKSAKQNIQPRTAVQRITPSKTAQYNFSVEQFFAAPTTEAQNAATKKTQLSAAQRGTAIHEWFEKIDWITTRENLPPQPPAGIDPAKLCASPAMSPLALALRQPENVVELWREQTFELFMENENGGQWISGIFDRVVFYRAATGELHAEIYDYKSNTLRADEINNHEKFQTRLREEYTPQMLLYQQAIAKLCNLPAERISAKLLLTATLTVCEIME